MDYMDCLDCRSYRGIKEYHMRFQRFSLLAGLILSVFLVTLTTLPALAYSTISHAPRPLTPMVLTSQQASSGGTGSGRMVIRPASVTVSASSPGKKIPADNLNCISVSRSISATGTNTFQVNGTVKNNCGLTLYSGQVNLQYEEDCPAVASPTYSSVPIPIPDPWRSGVSYDYTDTGTGFCEFCTNGVPVGWPAFIEGVRAGAQGSNADGSEEYFAPNTPYTYITLSNSSRYTIPC
jgi:hypothetical protein